MKHSHGIEGIFAFYIFTWKANYLNGYCPKTNVSITTPPFRSRVALLCSRTHREKVLNIILLSVDTAIKFKSSIAFRCEIIWSEMKAVASASGKFQHCVCCPNKSWTCCRVCRFLFCIWGNKSGHEVNHGKQIKTFNMQVTDVCFAK